MPNARVSLVHAVQHYAYVHIYSCELHTHITLMLPIIPCFVQDFFFNLHDAGFAIFNKEANYENAAGGVEYAFIKLSTDFFVNNTMYSRINT